MHINFRFVLGLLVAWLLGEGLIYFSDAIWPKFKRHLGERRDTSCRRADHNRY